MTDPSWLDLPDGDGKARKKRQKLFPRTPKREELTATLRQCTVPQRLWIKALAMNGFDSRTARLALEQRGLKAPKSWTISRWATVNPAFVKAREMCSDMLYDADGPTKSMILGRINRIATYNAEEVLEMHQGQATGREMMRDASLALKANEMLGRSQKMFGDERDAAREGPQLIVQIISKDDPGRVIDVTPGRVSVPSRPGDEIEDAEVIGGS